MSTERKRRPRRRTRPLTQDEFYEASDRDDQESEEGQGIMTNDLSVSASPSRVEGEEPDCLLCGDRISDHGDSGCLACGCDASYETALQVLAALRTVERERDEAQQSLRETVIALDDAIHYRNLAQDQAGSLHAAVSALREQIAGLEQDKARLDVLEEFLDAVDFAHSRGGEPEPVLTFFVGDGGGSERFRCATIREAVDKFREQCGDIPATPTENGHER